MRHYSSPDMAYICEYLDMPEEAIALLHNADPRKTDFFCRVVVRAIIDTQVPLKNAIELAKKLEALPESERKSAELMIDWAEFEFVKALTKRLNEHFEDPEGTKTQRRKKKGGARR